MITAALSTPPSQQLHGLQSQGRCGQQSSHPRSCPQQQDASCAWKGKIPLGFLVRRVKGSNLRPPTQQNGDFFMHKWFLEKSLEHGGCNSSQCVPAPVPALLCQDPTGNSSGLGSGFRGNEATAPQTEKHRLPR